MIKKDFMKLFDEILKLMKLDQWTIDVKWTDGKDGNLGSCNAEHFVYRRIYIKFSTTILEEKLETIKQIIIHELLHAYMGFYVYDIQNTLKDFIKDNNIINLIHGSIISREETTVETLSIILTNLLKTKFKPTNIKKQNNVKTKSKTIKNKKNKNSK